VDRLHRLLRAVARRAAGDHRPALSNGVDAALVVLRRAERRAVVEVGAAVPVAVPRLAVERRLERRLVRTPRSGALRLAARLGELGERPQVRVEEPGEPDALAPAFAADAVHAVVPVA